MTRKKTGKDEAAVLRERAEELLRHLLWLKAVAVQVETDASREMEEIATRHREKLIGVQHRIKERETELQKLMKAGRAVFFADGDVHALSNGSLLRQVEKKVTIHGKKDEVVALLEAAGLLEAVKVEKSFDRDVINKWPDDQLAIIGAERKPVETFNYDLAPQR